MIFKCSDAKKKNHFAFCRRELQWKSKGMLNFSLEIPRHQGIIKHLEAA